MPAPPSSRPRLLAALLLLAAAAPALALPQKMQMVEDIQNAGSYTTIVDVLSAELGGFVYYVRDGEGTGPELHRVLATGGTPELVADIQPGPAGSRPEYLTAYAGQLIFVADDGTHGYELWRSDGTAAGTQMILDLMPGEGHGVEPSVYRRLPFPQADGLFYFAGEDPVNGREIWGSDGTAAGTQLVSTGGQSEPGQFPQWGKLNGAVLYIAKTYLWRITPTGAVQLGSGYSNPSRPIEAGGQAFFSARSSGALDYELWATDGTSAGTRQVADLHPTTSSYPYFLTPFGDRLVFTADDGAHGREPWISDGTSAGTVLLADIAPGPDSGAGANGLQSMAVFQGRTWFGGDSGTGAVLWSTDGTPSGTGPLFPSGGPSLDLTTSLPAGSVTGPRMFFGGDAGLGAELWSTDGTQAGTVPVADLNPGSASSGPRSYVHDGVGGVRVLADGPDGAGLWRSDGVTTSLIGDGAVSSEPQTGNSDPGGLVSLPDRLLFSASQSGIGNELFTLGGDGAELVFDLLPGSASAFASGDPEANVPVPIRAVVSGNKIYFFALDGLTRRLWVSDGTPAGTRNLTDFIDPGGAAPLFFGDLQAAALDDGIVFGVNTASQGWSLWRTDGTEAGTSLVADMIGPPAKFTRIGNRAFFFADQLTSLGQLFVTDGTPAGTLFLRQLDLAKSPGARGVGMGGVFYFPGANLGQGFELWRSDGTPAGTQRVADLAPGVPGSNPAYLTRVGSELYFAADDGTNGSELWRSDGTLAGTQRLTDVQPAQTGFAPVDLLAVGEQLFFRRIQGSTQKLYRLVGDQPQLASSFMPDAGIAWMTAVGTRRLFFRALDGPQFSNEFGAEIYSTEGSPASTRLFEDFLLNGWAQPEQLAVFDGQLYASLITPSKGRELHSAQIGAVSEPVGSGCAGSLLEPVLYAADPVLGTSIAITVRGAAPGSPVVLLRAQPSAALYLGGGCNAYLNPASLQVLAIAATDATGVWIAPPVAVPSTVGLTGVRTTLQAAVLSPQPAAFGFDLSNGQLLTLGD